MKISDLLLIVLAIVVAISLASAWLYPTVQDFMASNVMWNGLKNTSEAFNADNIDTLILPELPEQYVLISIPYTYYSKEDLSSMKQFVSDGGTLILMDDFGYGNSLLKSLGVVARFTNVPLLDPLFSHRNQYLPLITDLSKKLKDNGIETIMLNHGTSLTGVSQSEVLAWSSPKSFLDVNENGSQQDNEPAGPFAFVAELRLGKGRIDLIGDPSIIINTMVGRNDNLKLMKYLSSQGSEPKKVLVDRSHLSKTPLDVSKIQLMTLRQRLLSNQYVLVGVTAVIFALASAYMLRKGGAFGGY